MAQVSFRPMEVDDLPAMVRWRAQPHVLRWFADVVPDLDAAMQRYGPRIEGRTAVSMWVAMLEQSPFGFVQHFRVGDDDDLAVKVQDPEAVAFDYAIGEPHLVGQGLGPAMIDAFCRDILVRSCPEAPRFVALPDARNRRSLRALQRCGFRQGLWVQLPTSDFAEIVCSAPRSRFEPGSVEI